MNPILVASFAILFVIVIASMLFIVGMGPGNYREARRLLRRDGDLAVYDLHLRTANTPTRLAPTSLASLAETLHKRGSHRYAELLVRDALDAIPAAARAPEIFRLKYLLLLADTVRAQGRVSEAHALYCHADLRLRSGRLAGEARLGVARTSRDLGDASTAMEYFEKAADGREPARSAARQELAQLRELRGGTLDATTPSSRPTASSTPESGPQKVECVIVLHASTSLPDETIIRSVGAQVDPNAFDCSETMFSLYAVSAADIASGRAELDAESLVVARQGDGLSWGAIARCHFHGVQNISPVGDVCVATIVAP